MVFGKEYIMRCSSAELLKTDVSWDDVIVVSAGKLRKLKDSLNAVLCVKDDRKDISDVCLIARQNCPVYSVFPSGMASHSTIAQFNPLKPNDPYRGRTAPLTSKGCILYIYSTNISIEYFKHGIYSPSFPLQNTVCFIILRYFVPVLFTFHIQDVLKLKKK